MSTSDPLPLGRWVMSTNPYSGMKERVRICAEPKCSHGVCDDVEFCGRGGYCVCVTRDDEVSNAKA